MPDARNADPGEQPAMDRQVTTRDLSRLALKDEADEIVVKSLALSQCLQYAKQAIQDDDGETIDGVTWILNDNLRRLREIVKRLGR